MGLTLAQETKKGLELPATQATAGTTAPSTSTVPFATAKTQAHGKVPSSGAVMVEADADTYTIYIYNPTTNRWRFPGNDSGSYQKEFTETHGHMDFFEGPTGAMFLIVATGGSQTIYHNGDPV